MQGITLLHPALCAFGADFLKLGTQSEYLAKYESA